MGHGGTDRGNDSEPLQYQRTSADEIRAGQICAVGGS
jgi:hypothetical protein